MVLKIDLILGFIRCLSTKKQQTKKLRPMLKEYATKACYKVEPFWLKSILGTRDSICEFFFYSNKWLLADKETLKCK